MGYHQITPDERYTLAALRAQQPRLSNAEIARRMDRHRSTIGRELRRNRSLHDGKYRASKAQEHANGRRSRSRHWTKLTEREWMRIEDLLFEGLSPAQVSGRLARDGGPLQVSHETIYKYILADKAADGCLHLALRQRTRLRRKRYATTERRGRVAGKRHITERPASAADRREFGHWEIDTVHGNGRDSVVTIVERSTGITIIGKLPNLEAKTLTARVLWMMRRFQAVHGPSFLTITSDNGSEFNDYRTIERATGVAFYFATPHHAWERGTNENTNGLIRQYLPKRTSFADVVQRDCNAIAQRLNRRPRKRYAFATPMERKEELLAMSRTFDDDQKTSQDVDAPRPLDVAPLSTYTGPVSVAVRP